MLVPRTGRSHNMAASAIANFRFGNGHEVHRRIPGSENQTGAVLRLNDARGQTGWRVLVRHRATRVAA
jgi:hypothetical protein